MSTICNSKNNTLISLLFIGLFAFILQLSPFMSVLLTGKILSIFLICISFYMVTLAIYRKNIIVTIILLFFSLYSYTPKYYFFDRIHTSSHQKYWSDDTVLTVVILLCLFYLVLCLFSNIRADIQERCFRFRNNPILFFLLIFIINIGTVFASSGNSIFVSGGYSGEAEVSSFNEYIIILILMAYIFSGNRKSLLLILWISTSIYLLKSLFMGGRGETIMTMLLLLFIHFRYVFSFKFLMIFCIVGLYIMKIFENIRQNIYIFLSQDWIDVFLPWSSLEYRNSLGTNQGDVFYASERILILINSGYLNIEQRISSFFYFLLASIVPFSKLPPEANLSSYMTEYFTCGGGGLAPVYFFVFLSYPGVLLFGYFVARCLSNINRPIQEYKQVYLILFVATLSRWFAYYPIQLIKYCLYGVLLYLILVSIDKYIKCDFSIKFYNS